MPAPLCYCGNVHPARDLDELLQSLASGPALVRAALGVDRLSFGLWMSWDALRESIADDHNRLRRALDDHRLDVWTMNAFPVGNFHAPVVKHDVYRPHWADPERLSYTLAAARLLALLLPEGSVGSISTLPIGYGRDFIDPGIRQAADEQLRIAARALAAIADQNDKHIRLCLEPEPACVLETGQDAIDAFESLRARDTDLVDRHLGLCLDTCHHALAFEDPRALLDALHAADVTIGKVQLSSAAELDPSDPLAREALRSLDEPRFLHQVRGYRGPGDIVGCDDLDAADTLPPSQRWRVHYHLPIHHEQHGALHTTQSFLTEILRLLPKSSSPHLEVETYTWGVLPIADRPQTPEALASCIAQELRFVQGELA